MTYIVKISWEKDSDENFMANKYSRAHTWVFDGGIKIAASSSPHVVPVPMSLVYSRQANMIFKEVCFFIVFFRGGGNLNIAILEIHIYI